jgi:trinucleotide repeat-containing gene 6 protein
LACYLSEKKRLKIHTLKFVFTDDKLDKGQAPWDRQSSNGSGSMLNGRNNEGSFGTWNSNMIQNGAKKENNWGEESDPHGAGGPANVDDGTNLWGANKQRNMRWNDDSIGDGRMKTPNGPGPQMNNGGQFGGPTSPGRMMGNKPNNGMNNKPNQSNNSWNDMNNSNWNNDYAKGNQMQNAGSHQHQNQNKGAGVWNENASMHWNNGHKNQNGSMSGNSMADSSEWAHSKRRMVNREMILSSNQYRILVEMGFKKDDVENALRTCNMNLEETLEELRTIALRETNFDAERQKVSDLTTEVLSALSNSTRFLTSCCIQAPFNHASNLPMNSGMGNRNNSMVNQMGPQGSGLHGNQPGMRQQGVPKHGQHAGGVMPNNMAGNNNMNSMPSEKQLNHLVQQIQLAVRSGHLNAQILNQPLGLPTIQLIYQLLQQIKTLQQLQVQIQSNSNKPVQSSLLATLHIQISQVRARISSLQNQIKFQQALFMNQQSCPQGPKTGQPSMQSQASQQLLSSQLANSNNSAQLPPLALNSPALDFKNLMPSDANNLSDFRPQQQLEQSRLNQWKMNSFHKDPSLSQSNSSFSRAPGSLKSSNNSSNLAQSGSGSPLDMGPAASAWSSLGLDEPQSSGSSWSPTSPAGNSSLTNFLDNNADNFMNQNAFSSVQDQVPEFQPGKPWKGSSQLKQFEDDPNLTPGSANNWGRSNEIAFQTSQTWAFGSLRGSDSSQFKPSEWESMGSGNGNTSPGSSPIEQLWNRSDASLSKSRGPPPGMTPGKSGKSDLSCEPQNNQNDSMDGVFGCGVIVMNLPSSVTTSFF